MDQMADRVGLSRSALHERFVQFIGMTPMQYLTNWRLQIASRFLTQSNATPASVALDAGYDSEAAFSRAFKRAVGVPHRVAPRACGINRQRGIGRPRRQHPRHRCAQRLMLRSLRTRCRPRGSADAG